MLGLLFMKPILKLILKESSGFQSPKLDPFTVLYSSI